MWTKAPRDPVDRAGLADKVGGEAWQLRKLRQNVEQLTESSVRAEVKIMHMLALF